MFDHQAMQDTIEIVGIDLCFSGMDERTLFPIRSCMKQEMRFADLEHAEWFWATYTNTMHIVARHEPTEIPSHLLSDLQEMVYDHGVAIADMIGTILGQAITCEGMEFHFPGQPIIHAPNRLHRM